ncbi:MAG: hypothetical protein H6597_06540 [Flavobacteriales bacterium]|nr:hypothetical protein [Flavobacteriales bacterium]MCB9194174.1 hypothetical protein [Flavobacteriales bacterium]
MRCICTCVSGTPDSLPERTNQRPMVPRVNAIRVGIGLQCAPLNQPNAAYGPFVVNTVEEIYQAMADVQAGNFGELADRSDRIAWDGAVVSHGPVSSIDSRTSLVCLGQLLHLCARGRGATDGLKDHVAVVVRPGVLDGTVEVHIARVVHVADHIGGRGAADSLKNGIAVVVRAGVLHHTVHGGIPRPQTAIVPVRSSRIGPEGGGQGRSQVDIGVIAEHQRR